MNTEYIAIPDFLLRNSTLFPFHIYLKNIASEEIQNFVPAGTPFKKDQWKQYDRFYQGTHELCIKQKQKRTFLDYFSIPEKEFDAILSGEEDDVSQAQTEEASILIEAFQNNNFNALLDFVANKINNTPTNSDSGKTTKKLCSLFLKNPSPSAMAICFSYLLANKIGDYANEQILALIFATIVRDVGLNYVSPTEAQKHPLTEVNHIRETINIINRSGLPVSELTTLIIADHHEKSDGTGFPRNKTKYNIQELALVLAAVDNLLDSESLHSGISKWRDTNLSARLKLEFGDKIYQNMIQLLTFNKTVSMNKQAA